MIFAPHPLIKNYSTRNKIDIDIDTVTSDNIIVDFYSKNNVDGSYLNVADVYIGDVSSMITDFIFKRNKSCIFINSHDIEWKNDTNYKFWNCGKVINNLTELDSSVKTSLKENKYSKEQKAYIKKMIFTGSFSSSELIAETINNNL